MERMARQGIHFSTFYAQSVSSPSRTSILNEQNAVRHHTPNWINAESNNRTPFGPKDWNWQGISKGTSTLPKILQLVGYKTIQIGKAYFGPIGSKAENPEHIGFDVSIIGSAIGHPESYYEEYGYIKEQKERAVPELEKYHGTNPFLSDALTFEANEQIDKAMPKRNHFSFIWATMPCMLLLKQTSVLSVTIPTLTNPLRPKLSPP